MLYGGIITNTLCGSILGSNIKQKVESISYISIALQLFAVTFQYMLNVFNTKSKLYNRTTIDLVAQLKELIVRENHILIRKHLTRVTPDKYWSNLTLIAVWVTTYHYSHS